VLADSPTEFRPRLSDRPRVLIALGIGAAALFGIGIAIGAALGGDSPETVVTEIDTESENAAAAAQLSDAAAAAEERVADLHGQLRALQDRITRLENQPAAGGISGPDREAESHAPGTSGGGHEEEGQGGRGGGSARSQGPREDGGQPRQGGQPPE
jgi:hypothetical protein